MNGVGHPSYTDEQYQAWLDSMSTWLKNGSSLYYSLQQAGLTQHKDSIYRKYRLKDWFCEKIDVFRQEPGELVNDAIVCLIRCITDKVKNKVALTSEENKMLMFYAEKSRAAQPFFVNRQETAPSKPIEDILGELDNNPDDGHDALAEHAQKELEKVNDVTSSG